MVAKAQTHSRFDLFLKIWDREKLTIPLAKGVLKLGFSDAELERVSALRAKNSAGVITADEHAEYDAFIEVSTIIGILQSRARMFLKASKSKTAVS